MSGRELAVLARPEETPGTHLDSWISGILKGTQALSWKHFDTVCEALRISPCELVREDGSELRELTPTEMQLLRHFQQWPAAVQDRWLKLLEYFASSPLDQETRRTLHDLKELNAGQRKVLRMFLAAQRTRKP